MVVLMLVVGGSVCAPLWWGAWSLLLRWGFGGRGGRSSLLQELVEESLLNIDASWNIRFSISSSVVMSDTKSG